MRDLTLPGRARKPDITPKIQGPLNVAPRRRARAKFSIGVAPTSDLPPAASYPA
jgi:hypothetical protein